MGQGATPTGVTDLESLTPAQRSRRQRIISAAVELASKGGYGGVQMRQVADEADVALGTVYRYFPSKVHLLVAALHEQSMEVQRDLNRRPARGGDAAERTLDLLRRATRAMERDPTLTAAMLRALMFAGPSATSVVNEVSGITTRLIVGAIRADDEPATDDEHRIARVLEQVWLSSLLVWLSGRASSRQLHENLETATRLLLQGSQR